MVQLNAYLNFPGNAREVIEFYQTVLGGDLDLNTFGESGMPHDPADADKVMHAQLTADNGMVLMVSDLPPGMEYKPGTNIGLSLSGDDEDTLRGYWDKLVEGGEIVMALEKAPWGDTFGACNDKFGINWMVNISPKA